MPDAIVVGAGPNGLAAAIVLAQAGKSVLVLEAEDTIGGGTRSAALTLPGFLHDTCSAIHPMALASPFFKSLPLGRYGLDFIHPPLPLAHPFDNNTAAVLHRSLSETVQGLGRDGGAYGRLMNPLVRGADRLVRDFLGPLRPSRDLFLMGRFGRLALQSGAGLARRRFREESTQSLFAGLAAHSILALNQPASAAAGLMLAVAAHAAGWPLCRGGSQTIADALAAHLRTLGGHIEVGRRVDAISDLPPVGAVLFDVTPRQLLRIAGSRFPPTFRRALERFRYGPGVFKVDWALAGPIPWLAPACALAGTVHLGGTLPEIAASERAVADGMAPERPFVLLAQQSLFDPSRAPADNHTAWAYCHVPNGCAVEMTDRIEAQVERFAPGFRARILARSVRSPADLERSNANLVGGDINGGLGDLRQLFIRPTRRLYSTPDRALYICSSSTPPTGGVHGMCGFFGARAALRRTFA